MAITRRATGHTPLTKPSAKDDLFADLDGSERRKPGCMSCRNLGCLFLFAGMLVVVGILGVVAETGLVKIPVLSSVLYAQAPRPIRPVTPVGVTDPLALLKGKAAESGGAQVSVTEGELTQLVQEPRTNGQVPVKQAQVAIEPQFVELYGLLSIDQGASTTVMRVRLVPSSVPGEFRLSDIHIGYVRVPLELAKFIVKTATGITPPDAVSAASLGVRSVVLGQGVATVDLDTSAFTGSN